MNTIKCKFCGKEQPITEALEHQMIEQISLKLKTQHEEELELIKKKTRDLALSDLEKIKKETRESALSELELKLKDKSNETVELRTKNKELQESVLQMSRTLRELKEKMDRQELENEKKLNIEREKLKEQSMKIATEKSQSEMLELKKKLEDTKLALETANYKLTQTSQQLQGEILELDLEKTLRETFVFDEIIPVGKGVQGADIIQKVKNRNGNLAGIILWETKDAKWTPNWLPKLREDGRKTEATLVVLACKNPPKDVKYFQFIDNVLITPITYALPLAELLRRGIIQTAIAKHTVSNKDEKLEILFEYIQSEAFRHRFESFAEGIKSMHDDLETERRSMERVWKKREMQIRKMMVNASRMYGELQGVMGNALPEIKSFMLPEQQSLEDTEN